VHPCKHAHVIKKLINQRLEATGEYKISEIRADQYLCIFLKFMGSVIPTISYDYSLAL
jgi:ubiquitin-like-conjugating enzyme ATG3